MDKETDKKIVIQQGNCPKCGRPIDDYQASEPHDDQLEYPFHCPCGFNGSEWYTLNFVAFHDNDKGVDIK